MNRLRAWFRLSAAVAALFPGPSLAAPDTFFLGNGQDGALTVNSSGTVINAYAAATAPIPAGATSISVSSTAGFASNDLIMVHHTTGLTPVPASGDQNQIDLSNADVGRFELARVSSIGAGTLNLAEGMANSFPASGVQVLTVPEFTTVNVNAGNIVPSPWNGTTGGIVAFLATGNLTIASNGVHANGYGFRAGAYADAPGVQTGCTSLDQSSPNGGMKGESFYPSNFSISFAGRGNFGNGAGGGVCYMSGGGGGGGGGAGGNGGASNDGLRAVGGMGGASILYSPMTRLLFGGGGGAGQGQGNSGADAGAGGGIVFIRAGSLSGGLATRISAVGGNAGNTGFDGASGGGGGGTVHIRLAGVATCSRLAADGGLGGYPGVTDPGTGGGGGGGRVFLQKDSGTCTLRVNGGSAGNAQGNVGANGSVGAAEEVTPGFIQPEVPTLSTPADESSVGLRPTFSGNGDSTAEVVIYLDNVEYARATPSEAGVWEHTPTSDLSAGQHQVKVALAKWGILSAFSATHTFTASNKPAAPSVTTPSQPYTLTGNPEFQFEGTAPAESTVEMMIGSNVVNSASVSEGGAWSMTYTLAQGINEITFRTQELNSTSDPTQSYTVEVDTLAPNAPTIQTPVHDSYINDAAPTFTGTAEPDSVVTFSIDGNTSHTTQANGQGEFSYTPTTPLAEGPHAVYAFATDAADNDSENSSTIAFTIDITPPTAPAISSPVAATLTNTTSPVFEGTAEPGSTVTVTIDGDTIGTALADGSGNWSMTQQTTLLDGPHQGKAYATDRASNSSGTTSVNFVSDGTPPAAPVVTAPVNSSFIKDTTPTVSGTAEPLSTVTVSIDGSPVDTANVNPQGEWSYTPTVPLMAGPHTVRVTAKDGADNVSPESNTVSFTVDVTAPDAPVITVPANDAFTNQITPSFSGTAEADSTVEVSIDGTPNGTASADNDGKWDYTPSSPLGPGVHAVKATATDAAGNVSEFSSTTSFTIDTTPPPVPVLSTPVGNSFTNDNTPTFSGTAEANSTVTVLLDGHSFGSASADGSGNWTFTSSVTLTDALHEARVEAKDAAGNTSAQSSITQFTVDTAPPAAPVLTQPANQGRLQSLAQVKGTAEPNSTVTVYLDNASAGTTGADGSGNWTFDLVQSLSEASHTVKATATDSASNTSLDSSTHTFVIDQTSPGVPVISSPTPSQLLADDTPTFSGTAEASSTVSVYIDDVLSGTTSADGSGAWSYTVSSALSSASHSVKAKAADAAGNESGFSAAVSFTVDAIDPPAPVIVAPAEAAFVNTATPVISGTAEASSTVTLYVDAVQVGTANADASGNFSFTPSSALSEGARGIHATATDAAGNVGDPSATRHITVDTVAPSPPAVLAPTGPISSTTPTISGTAEADSTVTVSIDGTVSGTANANGQGVWSHPLSPPLSQGSHSATATATDAAGNTGAASSAAQFVVDTLPPADPVLTAPAAFVSDTHPVIAGTAEAHSTVSVYVDSSLLGTATAAGDGAFTFTPSSPLGDGPHTAQVTATDAAENVSAFSNSLGFTVDTSAPDAPTLEPLAARIATGLPTFEGTAEALSTVRVFVDGTLVGTATANSNGGFSLVPSAPLAEGAHTAQARAIDAAENSGALSAPISFTVDTVAPEAPLFLSPESGSHLASTQPALTGIAEPQSLVTLFAGGTALGTVTADGNGGWSFTPSSPLAEGAVTFTAKATDDMGNESADSAALELVLDVTSPDTMLVEPVVQFDSNRPLTFHLDSNEEGVRFECSLDDGPFSLCTEEMTIPALSVGDHVLKVRAVDLAGNVDETPLEHAFNVRYPAEKLRTNVGGGIGCAQAGSGLGWVWLALMPLVLRGFLPRRRWRGRRWALR